MIPLFSISVDYRDETSVRATARDLMILLLAFFLRAARNFTCVCVFVCVSQLVSTIVEMRQGSVRAILHSSSKAS